TAWTFRATKTSGRLFEPAVLPFLPFLPFCGGGGGGQRAGGIPVRGPEHSTRAAVGDPPSKRQERKETGERRDGRGMVGVKTGAGRRLAGMGLEPRLTS